MIIEETQRQIFDKSTQQLKSTMTLFTNQLLNQFQHSFDSLNAIYLKRQSEKQKIILEQRDTISNMKKFMDFMEGFAQNYDKFMKGSESFTNFKPMISAQQTIPSKNENKGLFNGSIHGSKNNLVEKEKMSTENRKKSNQKQSHSATDRHKIKEKPQELKKPQQVHLKKRQQQKKPVERKKVVQQNQPQKKAKQNNDMRLKTKEKKVEKNPLQCRASHPLSQVTFRPNVSTLEYVQYEHKRLQVFDEQEVKLLDMYDLSGVSSVAISGRQVSNYVLSLFTNLQWYNLKSLRIENNLITDIRPLGNLNLKIIEDLDVSFNPLSVQSAYFLAIAPFDELIYLTVSFETGLDDECWKVMLKNQMENYPKIQAIDICNSNQLNSTIKLSIQSCINRKCLIQKMKSREQGNSKYPDDYQIKISWNQSKEIFQTYTDQKIRQIGEKWKRSVGYQEKRLKRVAARINRKFSGRNLSRNKPGRKKIKPIRKARVPVVQCKKKVEYSQSHNNSQSEDSQSQSEIEDA